MRRRPPPRREGERDTVLARLRRAGLEPRKGLGQHFLHDPRILADIAAAARLAPGDRVLEIGTGPGTLTRALCARAGRVLTVEVDPRLLDFAREELADQEGVEFLCSDALDGKGGLHPRVAAAAAALGPFKLVANLPYSIATPLLLAVLSSGLPLVLAAATIQRELAGRLCAEVGTRQYGPLTALVAFRAAVERVRTLPAGAFWPPPEVTSEVVRIVPRPQALAEEALYPAYRAWVHRLLSQRRKQVGGLLREILGESGALEALRLVGLERSARPDSLRPEAFVSLARKYRTFEFDSPGNPLKISGLKPLEGEESPAGK